MLAPSVEGRSEATAALPDVDPRGESGEQCWFALIASLHAGVAFFSPLCWARVLR